MFASLPHRAHVWHGHAQSALSGGEKPRHDSWYTLGSVLERVGACGSVWERTGAHGSARGCVVLGLAIDEVGLAVDLMMD